MATDDLTAYAWLTIAATTNHPDIHKSAAEMRNLLQEKLTPEELKQAQDLAKKMYANVKTPAPGTIQYQENEAPTPENNPPK